MLVNGLTTVVWGVTSQLTGAEVTSVPYYYPVLPGGASENSRSGV